MITDERLKEWITACNTERGILENTTVLQISDALSELLDARRKIEDNESYIGYLRGILRKNGIPEASNE